MQITPEYSLNQLINGQYEAGQAIGIIKALASAAAHMQHKLSCVYEADGSRRLCESAETAAAINIERAQLSAASVSWKNSDVIPNSDPIIAILNDGSVHSGSFYVKRSPVGLCNFMSVDDDFDCAWENVALWTYRPEAENDQEDDDAVFLRSYQREMLNDFRSAAAIKTLIEKVIAEVFPNEGMDLGDGHIACHRHEGVKPGPVDPERKPYLARLLEFNGRDISVTNLLQMNDLYIEMRLDESLSEMDIQVAKAVESIVLSLKDVLDKNCNSKGFICISAKID